MENSEVQLEEINRQIDVINLNLKVCDSHIAYLHNINTLCPNNKSLKSENDKRIVEDTYHRIELQKKLKELMDKSFKLQEKILIQECDNIE